jgi:hypothetical protein
MLERPHHGWPPRRIYVASKARHFGWWQALKACGLPIVCSWISWERNIDGQEPTADEWSRHSDRCFREAADADILLLYCNGDDERHFGSLLEDRRCVGWRRDDLSHHPASVGVLTPSPEGAHVSRSCFGDQRHHGGAQRGKRAKNG